MYQKESSLDKENSFTIEISEKNVEKMQKRKNLLVEMNISYQAWIKNLKMKTQQNGQTIKKLKPCQI